jgi:hypothetical protein
MLGIVCYVRGRRDRHRGTASAGEYVDDFCGLDVARHGLKKQTLADFAERPGADGRQRCSTSAVGVGCVDFLPATR